MRDLSHRHGWLKKQLCLSFFEKQKYVYLRKIENALSINVFMCTSDATLSTADVTL
jgi:hypothetical protein